MKIRLHKFYTEDSMESIKFLSFNQMNQVRKLTRIKKLPLHLDKNSCLSYLKKNSTQNQIIANFQNILQCLSIFIFFKHLSVSIGCCKYISSLFNPWHSVLTAILFCGLCFGRCTSKIWLQQFDPSHFLCSLGHNKTQDTIPQQLMKLNLPPS